MYPEPLLRRRRPRRLLDHLFGNDEDLNLPPGVIPFNPNAGIMRPRRDTPRTDEFAPYEGPPPPPGSFMGDAPTPVNRPLPPGRVLRVVPEPPPPPFVPATLASIGEPPAYTRTRPAFPTHITDDVAKLRELQNTPVERSRLKSAGMGFLAKGIPGAIAGAFQPAMYGEMKRDRKIRQIEDRMSGDLALRRAQMQDELLGSQIEENRAQSARQARPARPILGRETMEDGTVVQTELNPETGTFEPSIGSGGAPIVLSRPKAPPPMVEMTLSDGRKVMVPESTALTADATRSNREQTREARQVEKESEREGQRFAAQDEFDQLAADEIAAGEEKNRAYAYLEQLKANPNVTEQDILEATRAAEAANTFYRSFGPKKVAAKAKISRYSAPTRPDRPAAKTLPPDIETRIRSEAAKRGLDPEVAVKRARSRL